MKKILTIVCLLLAVKLIAVPQPDIKHNAFTTNDIVFDMHGIGMNNLGFIVVTGLTAQTLVVTQLTIGGVTIVSNSFSTTNTFYVYITNWFTNNYYYTNWFTNYYTNLASITTITGNSNNITLNNGYWILPINGTGALTNLYCNGAYAWATLIVSNASATTNVFSYATAGDKIGANTTNVLNVPPGKKAFISIFSVPSAQTNYRTSYQQ